MTTWEYKTATYYSDDDFNRLGAEGWELVAIVSGAGADSHAEIYQGVFKRRVSGMTVVNIIEGQAPAELVRTEVIRLFRELGR